MGGGSFTAHDWSNYSTRHIAGKSVNQIYNSSKLHDDLNVKNVEYREARDNDEYPETTPILITLDTTGSMGKVLEAVAKNIGTMMLEILDRKPVTDPQIAIAAVDDVRVGYDVPFQMSQFESDVRIAEHLKKVFFTRCGGGNGFESYMLAYYFAAQHVKADAFEKRNKKGFLFTIGDEEPTPDITAEEVETVFGYRPERGFSQDDLYNMASKNWNLYHLIIEEGSHCQYDRNSVVSKWTALLGENAIPVSDCTAIAEVVVSILQRVSGQDTDDIVQSWDGSKQVAVRNAISGLQTTSTSSDDLVTL